MFWVWGFSLVILWTVISTGNATPLQCYACSKCDDCSNAPLTACFDDQDVCTIVATWDGNPYNSLKVAKECDSKSHCPRNAIDSNETHCDVTSDGVRCMSCCTGNACNFGAVGDFPIPPPMPPIQVYKFDSCADSMDCEVTANVKENVINVNKYCNKPITNGYTDPQKNIDQCNIQNEEDVCFTCCDKNCYKSTSDSHRTSYSTVLIVVLGFISYLKIHR